MTCSRSLAFAALFVIGVAPTTARADDADEAKSLFARGRELVAAGKCDEAVGKFRRAYQLYPGGLGALRNLAMCEESLGQYAAARRDYWDLRGRVLESRDRKYDGWDKEANAGFARLSDKVGRLTVKIDGDAANAAVTVNGSPFDTRLVGEEIERDPGTYVFVASTPTARDSRSAGLAAGGRVTVTLVLPIPPKPASSPPPLPPPTATGPSGDAPSSGAAARTAGWILIGTGVLAAAGAGVSLAIRQSAIATIDDECASHQSCDPGLRTTHDRGAAASLAVPILGGVAAAAIGVGAVLVLTAHKKPSSVGVTITPIAGGAFSTARVAF